MQLTITATDAVTGLSSSLTKQVDVNNKPVAQFIGARGGLSNSLSNFTTANATIGPLKCTKLFNSAQLPSSFLGQTESQLPDGVVPVVCYKQVNTNVASYVKSVTRPLWLVYHQEPEGDYALGSTFVNEFQSQSVLIRAQNNPLVKVVLCSAGYPYRNNGTADVLSGNYIVPPGFVDYYCKDVYQSGALNWTTQGLANYPVWTNWYNLVKTLGKPIGITEYGIGADQGNAVRNQRIKDDCAYLRSTFSGDLIMWQYWWSNTQGTGNPAQVWQFTDSATINTWKQIASGTL